MLFFSALCSFASAQDFGGLSPASPNWCDIDGNGALDLVAVLGSTVVWYPRVGPNHTSSSPGGVVAPDGASGTRVICADLNKDSYPDGRNGIASVFVLCCCCLV